MSSNSSKIAGGLYEPLKSPLVYNDIISMHENVGKLNSMKLVKGRYVHGLKSNAIVTDAMSVILL